MKRFRKKKPGQRDEKELDQRKVFTRRAALFAGSQVVVGAALAARMYQLQVVQSEELAVQAEDNRVNTRLLIPNRGRLFDRNGETVAANREDYRVYIIADRTPEFAATLERLAEMIRLPDDTRLRLLREGRRRDKRTIPLTVMSNLTWDQVARIEANTPDLPGVFVEQGVTRTYAASSATVHVTGYVGPPSEDDQASDGDPLLSLPEFRLGKQGIEKVLDAPMRGKSGYAEVEINAAGKVQRELNRKEGTAGTDVTLSIDLELQRVAMGLLGQHETASAVVMDVHSGEVIILASHPGYDPNVFVSGINPVLWRTLNANPHTPLINKCIAGTYAPGSTFKMMTAIAGLESGAITPASSFSCGGAMQLGSAVFHCWKRGGHGGLALRDAIKQSCDVYFYQTALATGIDRMAAIGRKFSFGTLTGIDLPNEKPAIMPDTSWKAETFKEDKKFHSGELAIIGIGQGYVIATPLQLAVYVARLVNGGRAVVPRVVRSPIELATTRSKAPDGRFPSLGLSTRHLNFLADAMAGVVNEPGGTALRSKIEEKAMAMGGKTGTSQVRRITAAERATGVVKNEDLPWDKRDHALFLAYAPVHAPKYACAVVVEHGGGGGAVAAPIARELMLAVQRKHPATASLPPEKPVLPVRSRAERR